MAPTSSGVEVDQGIDEGRTMSKGEAIEAFRNAGCSSERRDPSINLAAKPLLFLGTL
jgi:hypothetical protein